MDERSINAATVAKAIGALKQAADDSTVPGVPGKSLLPTFDKLITGEFVAIHQYTAHYAVAKNLGYTKLAAAILEHLNDERRHVDLLTERSVYLGGTPDISAKLDATVGKTVPMMFEKDRGKEEGAIRDYNDAITEAVTAKDSVSRALFESIVKDEDHHVDEITTNQQQIAQMGLGQFLSTQV